MAGRSLVVEMRVYLAWRRARLTCKPLLIDVRNILFSRCQFELGNTAMMIHYLTDPAVASHRLLGTDWSVVGLLREVARSTNPPFHALIDGGALVTGMTNLEVARYEDLQFNRIVCMI